MFKFTSKKDLHSFCEGEFLPIEKVDDPVFSGKMMGDGFAVEPSSGDIYAPIDGEITVVFPTLHAYGIKTKKNIEVLLHLGINTVELNGKGFNAFVKVKDKVKQGDLIAKMDLEEIKKNNFPCTSMCIITSGEKISLVDFDKIGRASCRERV